MPHSIYYMEQQIQQPNPKQWLEQYGNQLYQYALPRVNDSLLAEDLVQDTFLAALNNLGSFKGLASEKTWLFAILKNKIIDHYRKKSQSNGLDTMPDLEPIADAFFTDDGDWIAHRRPMSWSYDESSAEKKEFQRIIQWCKAHLKTIQEQVFTLKYLEELDSEEICKVLNITSSNYWVLIHRARLQMRDCVEKSWIKN
jgi:RNA polymerase sigma-70 factor (TIGR02943 family)